MTENTSGAPGPRPGFDPRFPAEFQPGFDAESRTTRPTTRAMPPRGAQNARIASEPSQAPVSAGSTDRSPADELSAGSVPSASPVVTVNVDGATAYPASVPSRPWWQRLNPYLLALGVLGVLFIVAAVEYGRVVSDSNYYGGSDDRLPMMLAQFSFIGVPLLFVLGLATLTSVVAILAMRWRAT